MTHGLPAPHRRPAPRVREAVDVQPALLRLQHAGQAARRSRASGRPSTTRSTATRIIEASIVGRSLSRAASCRRARPATTRSSAATRYDPGARARAAARRPGYPGGRGLPPIDDLGERQERADPARARPRSAARSRPSASGPSSAISRTGRRSRRSCRRGSARSSSTPGSATRPTRTISSRMLFHSQERAQLHWLQQSRPSTRSSNSARRPESPAPCRALSPRREARSSTTRRIVPVLALHLRAPVPALREERRGERARRSVHPVPQDLARPPMMRGRRWPLRRCRRTLPVGHGARDLPAHERGHRGRRAPTAGGDHRRGRAARRSRSSRNLAALSQARCSSTTSPRSSRTSRASRPSRTSSTRSSSTPTAGSPRTAVARIASGRPLDDPVQRRAARRRGAR